MKNVLITGTSSGLGEGLARQLNASDWHVYGCSRRGCSITGVNDVHCDLTDYATVPAQLKALLENVEHLDLVVLNAGILGEIQDLSEAPMDAVKQTMEINVWANKAVLDWLQHWGKPIDQIIMISSGASILGNKGWGGYALSKAALNMLAKLYAHEFSDSHITALAPGIIDTAMMDHLCEEADAEAFPALNRLREARGSEIMPGPDAAAQKIISVLADLKTFPSGDFVDIRQILAPDLYQNLYANK